MLLGRKRCSFFSSFEKRELGTHISLCAVSALKIGWTDSIRWEETTNKRQGLGSERKEREREEDGSWKMIPFSLVRAREGEGRVLYRVQYGQTHTHARTDPQISFFLFPFPLLPLLHVSRSFIWRSFNHLRICYLGAEVQASTRLEQLPDQLRRDLVSVSTAGVWTHGCWGMSYSETH